MRHAFTLIAMPVLTLYEYGEISHAIQQVPFQSMKVAMWSAVNMHWLNWLCSKFELRSLHDQHI
jgi:hypothetical protein